MSPGAEDGPRGRTVSFQGAHDAKGVDNRVQRCPVGGAKGVQAGDGTDRDPRR